MKEEVSKEMKGILQRITSPWFFTFIPWWVVFNYDFLILVFGKLDTLQNISKYYCGTENLIYTVGGCFDAKWNWWMEPMLRKLGWPIVATVVSMMGVAWCISWVQDKYNSIMEKDYFWRRREAKLLCNIYKQEERFYLNIGIDLFDRYSANIKYSEDDIMERDQTLEEINGELLDKIPKTIKPLILARYIKMQSADQTNTKPPKNKTLFKNPFKRKTKK